MTPWLERLGHDLRGPLAPLQTATYLLKSGKVEAAQQRDLLELIERQVNRLGAMIDEMGDWSLVHQGRLLGRQGDCDGSLLLADALARPVMGDRLPLTIIDDGVVATVHGDQLRLTQLLRILLEYAASRAGDAAASVHLHASEGALSIDVASPGPAAADQANRLFQDPMEEPYDQGLGLQLLIACAIAEAHGGSLVAEGDATGLRLRCRLPLAPPSDG